MKILKNENKVLKIIFVVEMFILGLFIGNEILNASETFFYEPFVAEVTAYTNPNGNLTYTEQETIEGITIAAKKEWIGCCVALYYMDENGNIGDFYGYREVTDTGYGHDSTKYPGKGTIETGETVDVFISDLATAKAFGSKQMYIQVIPGKG